MSDPMYLTKAEHSLSKMKEYGINADLLRKILIFNEQQCKSATKSHSTTYCPSTDEKYLKMEDSEAKPKILYTEPGICRRDGRRRVRIYKLKHQAIKDKKIVLNYARVQISFEITNLID